MKKLFLTILLCLATLTLGAQTQQGYVKSIGKPGKKGQALSGVTVRVTGEHNAAISGSDGTFSMPMPGKKNGQPYTLQQVQKTGYELNEKTVIGRQYAFSSTVPLTIVMVSTAQLQADKQRIENNAYKAAEKNYMAKMEQLEQQLQEKSISEEQYRSELQELQDKFEKYQNLIDELAEHYAHTDYDVLDETEARINILIENGELEKADSLIHTLFDPVDVLKRNKEALAQLDQTIAGAQAIIEGANTQLAAVLKQQEKDAEYLYQLYTIALAQFDNMKAAQYIQIRAALDTTNVYWQHEAGDFILKYLANYQLAMEYFQLGLRQSLDKFGEQSYATATLYEYIGSIHLYQNKHDLALDYFQKALDIRKQLSDEDDLDIASSYNNLGGLYYELGDYSEALKYFQKTLYIYQQILGEDASETANSYNNIGGTYHMLGELSSAIEHYLKAIDIRERIFGTNHIETANSYGNIGMVYSREGDYEKALEYQLKALAIKERALGTEHPLTATSYSCIGSVYSNLGEFDKALDFLHKALAIDEHLFGEMHTRVAISYISIGEVYYLQHDYSNA